MARLRNLPPGRAGHLWLQHRLLTARRGAELLDQKLRILREESQRLALLTERTSAWWANALRDADLWQLRAVTLVGERGVRLAARLPETQVVLTRTQQMGVTYPAEATVRVPEVVPSAPPAASAALLAARKAYERAADAAAQHAVAESAAAILAMEEAATRHRLRALTTHWIPWLVDELAHSVLTLEEQERADSLRLRWVKAAETRPLAREGSRSEEGP